MAYHDRDDQLVQLRRRLQYFAMIARLQIDPRLNAKIDMSGVIQNTLVEINNELDKDNQRFVGEIPQGFLRKIFENNLNDAIRRFRARKRDVACEISLDETLDYTSARIQEWLAAKELSPRHEAIKEDELARLAEALETLLPAEREAIECRYFRGWQLKEIALHLDRSIDGIAGLLKRGLQKLRDYFQSSPP